MLKKSYRYLSFVLIISMVSILFIGCGKSSSAPAKESSTKKIKVGYIVNFASHEFYKNVIKGQKDTAAKLGVDYVVADANLDLQKQISLGEDMLAKKVDVLIVTPVDAKGVMPLIDEAKKEGIPVITEAVKATDQTAYVGINDFTGGYLDGKYAADYVKKNNLPTPKVLLIGLPALEACVNRTEGFKKGLLEVIPDAKIVAEVDGQGMKDKAMAIATNALTAHQDVNMIMGINDDSTLGGVQAYRAAGLDESKLVAFGFGVEGNSAKNELLNAKSPYKGGLAMFPENIGRLCVETAVKAAKGEKVGDIPVPITVMNNDNVKSFYTKSGDDWNIIWDAVIKVKVQ